MAVELPEYPDLAGFSTWAKRGVFAGIVGFASFGLFEMTISSFVHGPAGFWRPMRLASGLLLGPPDQINRVSSILTGLAIHLVLSIGFAVGFALVIRAAPPVAEAGWATFIVAGGMALALYLFNTWVIAANTAWAWLPEESSGIIQFFGHVFFFSGSVAWVLVEFQRKQPASLARVPDRA